MADAGRRRGPSDPLAAGRAALARGAWEKAQRHFQETLRREETPEALEGLAEAAWWRHNAAATFDARERAYRLYAARGDRPAAARMATWLATDSIEFRGEPAVANGWLQRARRLLEGLAPAPEHGWLTLWEGHLALMLHNDTATARRLGGEAAQAGHALGLVDMEMLGRALEGLALVSEGRVDEGMGRLDEASAAALAGEMSDLNAVGTALCYLIDACDRVRDFDRAAQWCARVKEFATARHFGALFSFCRPHYAVVLMWRGAWTEAEQELTIATRELAAIRPPMVVEGVVRLAELRWRQGRWDEAAKLFAQVEHEALAQLGRGEMALSQGDAAAAADLAERFLRRIPVEDRMERVAGLDLAARAALARRDTESVARALAELESAADAVGTAPLRAMAALVRGMVVAARGDAEQARRSLEDAVDLYETCGAPFEASRARVELARVLHALRRRDAALREALAARETLRRLGAAKEAERASSLARDISGASDAEAEASSLPGGLTPREADILRLIAAGRSNREIAQDLVLSVRTVERHISNIYVKLGATGKVARASATAFAHRHGILPPAAT